MTLLLCKASSHMCHRAGAQPVQDWQDLLQPQLARKVACTDAPREYIGLALKTMGLPLNASARDVRAAGFSEADVADAVRRVRAQVLSYCDTHDIDKSQIWCLYNDNHNTHSCCCSAVVTTCAP